MRETGGRELLGYVYKTQEREEEEEEILLGGLESLRGPSQINFSRHALYHLMSN